MKYSQGPWKWEGKVLCNEKNIVGGGDWDFSDANKRLIAAAPDLLEALKSIMELQTRGYVVLGDKCTEIARAAIDKAIGEEE
ncbi:hypothetical protein ACOZWM_003270 [Cronobacter malonaticus]